MHHSASSNSSGSASSTGGSGTASAGRSKGNNAPLEASLSASISNNQSAEGSISSEKLSAKSSSDRLPRKKHVTFSRDLQVSQSAGYGPAETASRLEDEPFLEASRGGSVNSREPNGWVQGGQEERGGSGERGTLDGSLNKKPLEGSLVNSQNRLWDITLSPNPSMLREEDTQQAGSQQGGARGSESEGKNEGGAQVDGSFLVFNLNGVGPIVGEEGPQEPTSAPAGKKRTAGHEREPEPDNNKRLIPMSDNDKASCRPWRPGLGIAMRQIATTSKLLSVALNLLCCGLSSLLIALETRMPHVVANGICHNGYWLLSH